MVVDASALAAILFAEPEQRRFIEAIETADSRRLSTATFVEASIIIESRLGTAGLHDLDKLIASAEIELVPVDAEQARIARAAFSRFGKGRHAARLNFGDCFAYALAKTLGEPLLCRAADFARTDATLATSLP